MTASKSYRAPSGKAPTPEPPTAAPRHAGPAQTPPCRKTLVLTPVSLPVNQQRHYFNLISILLKQPVIPEIKPESNRTKVKLFKHCGLLPRMPVGLFG